MAAPATAEAADLERMPRINPYQEFLQKEGLPVYRGFAIEDVGTLELGPWARRGGRGAYIDLDGNGQTNNGYVAEIPPGGSLAPGRQMYEEMLYVLEGNGATTVWYDNDRQQSFEWKKGSLFSIPLNALHQHHNGSGRGPARLLGVTSAPTVINLFHNLDFIFNCDFAFRDRFGGEDNYFDGQGKRYQKRILETNFVPDTYGIELHAWKERGAGGRNVMFELAHNTMAAHISEFPVGTYKKAHRHGPGAHVLILTGKGYSLLWPQGGAITQADWKPGSIVVPPNAWFHQHFNSGAEPARYLALRWGSQRYDTGGVFTSDTALVDVDVTQGGAQIEYPNEDPAVHERFENYLREAGATCRMAAMGVPGCTGPADAAIQP
ncbi:MAG: cupin domain-containing protein [Chloroflexi bacterium]|nr:cupin domain-containing protein [Chloroflexota bacterium]